MKGYPGHIDWPSNANIKRMEKINPTLKTIKTLLYNGGLIYAFLYSVVVMFVEPILQKQYLQRHDLSLSTLLHLRRCIAQLQKKLTKTPVSALGYNEHDKYMERSTQTSDDNIIQEDNSHWPEINVQLQSVKQELQYFNKFSGQTSETIEDFVFQTKMVTDQVQVTDNSQIFSNKSRDIIQGIREMKGWFVNGQVPR
ncbi:hypothetical protein SEUBUCD646_0N01170 [Saccharomyces eubayanus]|uniref:Peroxisomal protein import machinery n=2 Tax=Saccharomyces TaxID=4930 RepID=A0A6C1EFL0_SACPS|nr:PEX17-like protein [Saccharomyces eubayanus]KOG96958.1 PEX17-like protein [Saccharomyces eubayanus]QID87580.1 Peroxisomal protein import machinery [Saccharomyces pastorianus]CAI1672607.1 hypothetical protein SEUBUCD650_0N01170 [Saccharomyces eubayanus]CAI1703759.1 hypothetical protein SEUBUCD646_0N01170 [Saccharomyces eubayanus]